MITESLNIKLNPPSREDTFLPRYIARDGALAFAIGHGWDEAPEPERASGWRSWTCGGGRPGSRSALATWRSWTATTSWRT